MDNKRLILFVIFSFSLLLLWDAYQGKNHPSPDVPAPHTAKDASVPSSTLTPTAAPTGAPAATPNTSQMVKGDRIVVKTDVYYAEIDTNGGDLRKLVLPKVGASDDPKKPFIFLADEAPHFYVAQSGLLDAGLPNHKSVFKADAKEYTLKDGADKLEVRLTWSDERGVSVAKVFTFHRGQYLIDVAYEVKNGTNQALPASSYFQLVRDETAPAGTSSMTPTYTGPAFYTDKEKYHKHAFSDIGKDAKKDSFTATDGWVAMLQHYFLAAYLPAAGGSREFYAKKISDTLYAAGVVMPLGTIAPGASANIKVPLYVGPQTQATLKTLAPGLDLAVDYGWLTVIAVPIFWLLTAIHKIVGNWGWSIILLTVLIKAAFYPLSATSYKSMAKMKVLGPRLQRMKEQFGDDRQKLHQAMMELYKTEKINPLGGCLPVVVQIPVFIALYWVLLYSVEMRHAPWALWIHDLTAQDPYYVLPVLMGISMIIQTRLNPTPPDPIQAKVMMIMPVVFSAMFFFFPAGLVLYWVVNNVLSILQQWRINAVLGTDAKR